MLSANHLSRLLALVALGIALTAQAKVVSSSASGFVIENSAVVPTDPRISWSALVADVGRWWPADHTWFGRSENLRIDARAGGCFCEIDGDRQVQHMTIGFVDPGHMLRMIGGLGPLQGIGMYGALDWKFEPAEGGTRITLRYQAGGYAGDDLAVMLPVIDQVQGMQLGGLAAFLRQRHTEDGQ
jgi:uncharacterized protein YndB with AHSA1/START domain